jgi:hypothetical protein
MSKQFQDLQQAFTDYLRTPRTAALPKDMAKDRLEVYRQLLFNNMDSFLTNNFPILRQLLDDQQWFELVDDFYAQHPCQTPYFTKIPEEFIAYLQHERQADTDLPFLLELVHYEWVEMALSIANISSLGEQTLGADWLTQPMQLSSLAWPLVYQFPVHKIGPAFIPLTAPAQPSFLVVYRNQHDDVLFLEITPMTYHLLVLLQEQGSMTPEACLQQLSQSSPHANPEIIREGGTTIMLALLAKTILTQ